MTMMDWLADPTIWASLLTLTALEIVLGIDNLLFIAILADRLPPPRQAAGRQLGLALALITRLALLASIAWIAALTSPLFTIIDHPVSWRDVILIGGGLFLLYKGTHEMHALIEGEGGKPAATGRVSFTGTIAQIVVLDIVFSLDSVITAVGMASHLWVMMLAVVLAVIAMVAASTPLANFVSRHPTVKTLALSFLLLIGMTLVADGFGAHLPKGYIYAAIAFSVVVELLNQRVSRRRKSSAAVLTPPAATARRRSAAPPVRPPRSAGRTDAPG
jgi:predicted tellurium resistance membrane protein TerC